MSTVATSPGLAAARHHSPSASPTSAVRKTSSSANWAVPLQVTRIQVRCVRLRHLPRMRASRSSSRASAPKALTTALLPIASLSTPPSRVSSAFESAAAGSITRVASRPAVTTYSTVIAPTRAPMTGQVAPSISMVPTSTTSVGSSESSTTSLSPSSAHMPREILRTVEPEKVPACQSVERRCTR